jgi:hypothetical protein
MPALRDNGRRLMAAILGCDRSAAHAINIAKLPELLNLPRYSNLAPAARVWLGLFVPKLNTLPHAKGRRWDDGRKRPMPGQAQ